MKFSQQFLDRVIEKTTLSQIIGEKVKLKANGGEQTGLCPFHKEKSPSFTVNDNKGVYHCFGCGAGGNAVSFLCEQYNYSFTDAIKELAGRAGIPLEADPVDQFKSAEEKDIIDQVVNINTLACQWFSEQLYSPAGTQGRHYLIRRGLKKSSLDNFNVGYAPAGNKLRDYLLGLGYRDQLLLTSGLIGENADNHELYDRFRNRIIFPILDKNNRVIGFGGRALGDGKPKYLNSPETPAFHKGYHLYGLNVALDRIRKDKHPVLVAEGNLDVITMHQAGFKGCVAPMGTAMTQDQIQVLWKLSDSPILCFDGDAAGKKASLRAAEKALGVLRPGKTLQFAFLPNGEDPDSLIQSGSVNVLQKAIDNPTQLIDVLWHHNVAGKSIKTPEQKALVKDEAFKLIDTIQDQRVLSLYKEEFKKRFYELNSFKAGRKGAHKTENNFGIRTTFDKNKQQIYILLAIILNHPHIINVVEDAFMQADFPTQELNELRDEIFSFISEQDDIDKTKLKHHLINSGFEYILDKVLQPDLLIHAAFAKENATAQSAIDGFNEIWNLLFGKKQLMNDMEILRNDLENDLSPEAWKRFTDLKKHIND